MEMKHTCHFNGRVINTKYGLFFFFEPVNYQLLSGGNFAFSLSLEENADNYRFSSFYMKKYREDPFYVDSNTFGIHLFGAIINKKGGVKFIAREYGKANDRDDVYVKELKQEISNLWKDIEDRLNKIGSVEHIIIGHYGHEEGDPIPTCLAIIKKDSKTHLVSASLEDNKVAISLTEIEKDMLIGNDGRFLLYRPKDAANYYAITVDESGKLKTGSLNKKYSKEVEKLVKDKNTQIWNCVDTKVSIRAASEAITDLVVTNKGILYLFEQDKNNHIYSCEFRPYKVSDRVNKLNIKKVAKVHTMFGELNISRDSWKGEMIALTNDNKIVSLEMTDRGLDVSYIIRKDVKDLYDDYIGLDYNILTQEGEFIEGDKKVIINNVENVLFHKFMIEWEFSDKGGEEIKKHIEKEYQKAYGKEDKRKIVEAEGSTGSLVTTKCDYLAYIDKEGTLKYWFRNMEGKGREKGFIVKLVPTSHKANDYSLMLALDKPYTLAVPCK